MISLVRPLVLCTVICIILFAHTTYGQTQADTEYTSRFDDINVDEILANSRLRNQYVGCILNTSPCITGAARLLKEKFAEAFVTKCKLCTEKQKVFFDKIADWFTTNEPDTWNRAVKLAIEEMQGKKL